MKPQSAVHILTTQSVLQVVAKHTNCGSEKSSTEMKAMENCVHMSYKGKFVFYTSMQMFVLLCTTGMKR